jgi:hypothetical protein
MAVVATVVTDSRTLVLLVPEGVANGTRGTVLGTMSTATAEAALRFLITATREVLMRSAVLALGGEEV